MYNARGTFLVYRVGEYATKRIRARTAADAARQFAGHAVTYCTGSATAGRAEYVDGSGGEYHVRAARGAVA